MDHLTRVAEERRRQNMYNSNHFISNTYVKPHWNPKFSKPNISYNNYKYVKSKSCEETKSETPQMQPQNIYVNPIPVQPSSPNVPLLSNKVLINPHFKRSSTNVHVNPNFIPPKKLAVPTSVHINPKILSEKTIENINIVQNKKSTVIPKVQIANKPNNLAKVTQYKIIRNVNTPIKSCIPFKKKVSPPQSKYLVKTKFKLDRRNSKVIRKRKTSLKTISSKIKTINRSKNTRLVNIGGTFYNTTRNKLQRTETSKEVEKKVVKRYKKYSITNRNFRYVKNSEVKQCVKPVIRKINGIKKTKLATRYKLINKSKNVSPPSKNLKKSVRKVSRVSTKFRKNNVPCPIYIRYGKCSSQDKGICRRLHDPKLISICRKFLQGDCHVENCLLSHNVSLEKMPACKFFLNGFCSKENCPYLHVKLNDNVAICRDFLNGFCAAADKCDKRHVNICPEMDRVGKCSKNKCPYPHPGGISSVGKKHFNLISKNIPMPPSNIDETDNDTELVSQTLKNTRYFIQSEVDTLSNESSMTNDLNFPNELIGSCPDFIPFK